MRPRVYRVPELPRGPQRKRATDLPRGCAADALAGRLYHGHIFFPHIPSIPLLPGLVGVHFVRDTCWDPSPQLEHGPPSGHVVQHRVLLPHHPAADHVRRWVFSPERQFLQERGYNLNVCCCRDSNCGLRDRFGCVAGRPRRHVLSILPRGLTHVWIPSVGCRSCCNDCNIPGT
eukprot:Rmarinus@m.1450